MTRDWQQAGWAGDAQARPAFDASVAHQARIYDYWLGGKDNFAVDRQAAEQAIAAYPPIVRAVRAQRAFLTRAVEYLAGHAGIRQFLDIGTGLPTASNTHEVAQAAAPDARIVYVDNDRCKSGCVHACWAVALGRLVRASHDSDQGPDDRKPLRHRSHLRRTSPRQPAPAMGADAPPALTAAPSLEQTMRAWHTAGHSQRAIARELNIDRRKVKRVLDRAA